MLADLFLVENRVSSVILNPVSSPDRGALRFGTWGERSEIDLALAMRLSPTELLDEVFRALNGAYDQQVVSRYLLILSYAACLRDDVSISVEDLARILNHPSSHSSGVSESLACSIACVEILSRNASNRRVSGESVPLDLGLYMSPVRGEGMRSLFDGVGRRTPSAVLTAASSMWEDALAELAPRLDTSSRLQDPAGQQSASLKDARVAVLYESETQVVVSLDFTRADDGDLHFVQLIHTDMWRVVNYINGGDLRRAHDSKRVN